MAKSSPEEVLWVRAERAVWMLVRLKLSAQQPGLPGDGRDISYCLCREVVYEPAGCDEPRVVDATCGFGFPETSPVLKDMPSLLLWRLSLDRDAGSCLHSVLLLILTTAGSPSICPSSSSFCPVCCSVCGFGLVRLCSRQVKHCRNQDAVVRMMSQERQARNSTSKTFMPQGSGQQSLEFSSLVQTLQLFQELPLPWGCSVLPSSASS